MPFIWGGLQLWQMEKLDPTLRSCCFNSWHFLNPPVPGSQQWKFYQLFRKFLADNYLGRKRTHYYIFFCLWELVEVTFFFFELTFDTTKFTLFFCIQFKEQVLVNLYSCATTTVIQYWDTQCHTKKFPVTICH